MYRTYCVLVHRCWATIHAPWWPTPGVLIQPCPTSRDRNGVPFQYDYRDHGSCRHKQRSTHLFLIPPQTTKGAHPFAKTTQSDGALPIQRTISGTAIFFFVPHKKNIIRTYCSGNIFPTGWYVGSITVFNPMADTVDGRRTTSWGS